MIAILVAVKQELNPILRRANTPHVIRQEHLDFYEGTLAGQPVTLLALGVGKECARMAAEVTIRCYRPDLIISAGFGGGLQGQLNGGDIVIGTEALDLHPDDGKNVRCRSTQPLARYPELEADAGDFHLHFGKILTTDEMVLKSSVKARVGQATGAMAVDMETSAVAAVAAAHDTDFLAFRCISDTATENLPEEFNDFFIVGQLQPSRILAACARRPSLVLDLARMGYRAHQAGDSLAKFLVHAVTKLRLPNVINRNAA